MIIREQPAPALTPDGGYLRGEHPPSQWSEPPVERVGFSRPQALDRGPRPPLKV